MSNTAIPHPYLTDEEIMSLMSPLVQHAAIVRWFRANGFADCRVKPNGLPLIPRSQCNTTPTGAAPLLTEESSSSINVEALLKRYGKSAKSKAPA